MHSLIIEAMYEEAAMYQKIADDERYDDRQRERAQYKATQLRAVAGRMAKLVEAYKK